MVSYNFCQISHPTLILPLFILFLSLLNSVPGGGEVWQGIDHVINQIIIISYRYNTEGINLYVYNHIVSRIVSSIYGLYHIPHSVQKKLPLHSGNRPSQPPGGSQDSLACPFKK